MPVSEFNSASVVKPRYPAKDNGDGTYDIYDVEIFAEHERFGHKFNKEWLEKAINKAKLRAQEGYEAPLHVHHHGDVPENQTVAAGTFMPTKVVERQYNGKPTNVMLANFHRVPRDVFERMKKGELPYRSVEIGFKSFDDPEIDSLALLKTSAPYFKFPNLRPEEPVAALACSEGPMVRYAMTKAAYGTELKFDGEVVLQGTAVSSQEPHVEAAFGMQPPLPTQAPPPPGGSSSPSSPSQQPGGQPSTPPAMETKDPAAAKHEAIAELGKSITELLGQLIAVLNSDPKKDEDKDKNEDKDGMSDDDEFVQGGPVTMSAPAQPTAISSEAAEYAAMKGELAALKAKLAQQERERENEIKYQAALVELEPYGLTDESKAELKQIVSEHGEAALKAYMAAVKRYGTPDPKDEELDTTPTGVANIDPVIQKWMAKSPAAAQLALQAASKYDSSPDGLKSMYTKEQFVNAQVTMGLTAAANSQAH